MADLEGFSSLCRENRNILIEQSDQDSPVEQLHRDTLSTVILLKIVCEKKVTERGKRVCKVIFWSLTSG